MDPTKIHNFASKYEAFFGTPFDLDDVADDAFLDKNAITHVRLVDVVGSTDPAYATYDSEGHAVMESWPTPFGSSGFDLDAVGVIHDLANTDVPEQIGEAIALFPNPVKKLLNLKAERLQWVEIYNIDGQKVMNSSHNTIDLSSLSAGIYFVRVRCDGQVVTKRIVKQ